jgi:hypothetical protein
VVSPGWFWFCGGGIRTIIFNSGAGCEQYAGSGFQLKYTFCDPMSQNFNMFKTVQSYCS